MVKDSEKHDAVRNVNPWPHRLAVLLVCAVFPLIWVGGLVTTYEAGMAVPDWPTTYGYNLFFYPWQTWLFGPWDLFIEHGHRLLGAVVGLVTILLALVVWSCDPRRWIRWLVLAAFFLVCLQGLLGGMRVVYQSNHLAMIHGCVGPAFFALCVSIVAVTSSWWRSCGDGKGSVVDRKLIRLAIFTPPLAFVQLVLGAQLRHGAVDAAFTAFRVSVFAHLLMALVVSFHVALLAIYVFARFRDQTVLSRPAVGLCLLVFLQLLLGAGSWVVNYSWPHWMLSMRWTESFTIQAGGMFQGLVVTAHVANGSLILATAVLLAIRVLRLYRVAGNIGQGSRSSLSDVPPAGKGDNSYEERVISPFFGLLKGAMV